MTSVERHPYISGESSHLAFSLLPVQKALNPHTKRIGFQEDAVHKYVYWKYSCFEEILNVSITAYLLISLLNFHAQMQDALEESITFLFYFTTASIPTAPYSFLPLMPREY